MFVIEQADTMTVQAQNALLKTLEEPEEGTVFLLLAQNAQQMLSTVRSRCCPVRIPEFTAEEIERQLRAAWRCAGGGKAGGCGQHGRDRPCCRIAWQQGVRSTVCRRAGDFAHVP